MSYVMDVRKKVGHEPIINVGSTILVFNQNNELLLNFRSDTNDWGIPGGGKELNETLEECAIRELKEETGYISNDLFIVDKVFTSPGIDNSTTYIVVANNCIKTDEIKNNGTELVIYGLFSEVELKYLISNNIMNGAMNKLAYYNLVNNVEDYNVVYSNSNQKIYL